MLLLQIDPQSTFMALMFGSILGGIGKYAFDVAKNGNVRINRIFYEILALVMMVAGLGLAATQLIIYYFQLNHRIANGEFEPEFIYYMLIAFGCAVVAGGRLGLEYVLSLLKTIAEKFVNKGT